MCLIRVSYCSDCLVLPQFSPGSPNSIINLGKTVETSLFPTPGQVESCSGLSIDN